MIADDIMKTLGAYPLKGVRYNVIRRPLSGGKGSIKRGKPKKSDPWGESPDAFYKRLKGIIAEAPETYFMRWNVTIAPQDVNRFKRECLDPVLEQLCGWWEYVTTGRNSMADLMPMNFRFPYGIYNPMTEGTPSELDEYLATGSTAGLTRTGQLFGELEET